MVLETLKSLQGNIEVTLQDTGIGDDFLSRTPIVQEKIARINKQECEN
jgi:hypothetical protein